MITKSLFKIYLFIIYFEYSSNCVCQVELELDELLSLIQFSFKIRYDVFTILKIQVISEWYEKNKVKIIINLQTSSNWPIKLRFDFWLWVYNLIINFNFVSVNYSPPFLLFDSMLENIYKWYHSVGGRRSKAKYDERY